MLKLFGLFAVAVVFGKKGSSCPDKKPDENSYCRNRNTCYYDGRCCCSRGKCHMDTKFECIGNRWQGENDICKSYGCYNCMCDEPVDYSNVCGIDGKVYDDACTAKCLKAQVEVDHIDNEAVVGERCSPWNTEEPLDTADPTDTSEPWDIQEPLPTAAPQDLWWDSEEPLDTADPTDTSEPWDTADPTDTSEPWDTADPTDTSEPWDTADPTDPWRDTEKPLDTSEPSDTEVPWEPLDTESPHRHWWDTEEPLDTADPMVTSEPLNTAAPVNTDQQCPAEKPEENESCSCTETCYYDSRCCCRRGKCHRDTMFECIDGKWQGESNRCESTRCNKCMCDEPVDYSNVCGIDGKVYADACTAKCLKAVVEVDHIDNEASVGERCYPYNNAPMDG